MQRRGSASSRSGLQWWADRLLCPRCGVFSGNSESMQPRRYLRCSKKIFRIVNFVLRLSSINELLDLKFAVGDTSDGDGASFLRWLWMRCVKTYWDSEFGILSTNFSTTERTLAVKVNSWLSGMPFILPILLFTIPLLFEIIAKKPENMEEASFCPSATLNGPASWRVQKIKQALDVTSPFHSLSPLPPPFTFQFLNY